MDAIEEFFVSIGFVADTKKLSDIEKAAKESAERSAAAWSRFEGVIKSVGLSALGAGGGLLAFVERSTASAAAIDDAARKAQVGAREFQRLSFAASQAGSGPEALSAAFRTLSNAITDARKGTGPASEAFRALGISATSLVDLDAETRFGVIADALGKIEDPAKRSAIAMDILGRGGTDLLPMLADGSAGLKEMGDEAERLGIVLSDEALASAAAFDDELAAMKGQVGAVARDIGIGLIPVVRDMIKHWDDWAKAVAGVGVAFAGAKIGSFASSMQNVVGATAAAKLGVAGLTLAVGGLSYGLAQALDNALGLSDALAGVNQNTGGRGSALLGDLTDDEKGRLNAAVEKRNSLDADLDRIGLPPNVREMLQRDRNAVQAEIDSISRAGSGRAQGRKALAESREGVDTFVARDKGERLIADAAKANERGLAAGKKAGKKRGGGGGRKFEEDIGAGMFEADDAFGDELRRLASRHGVGELAVDAALRAAAESMAAGDARDVSRNAALSRLGSSAGVDLSTKGGGRDPLLSSILGDADAPDVPLSAITRGAEPQVLVSTVNNSYQFDNAITIDGAGDPNAVADATVDAFVRLSRGQVERASKFARLNFAR